jgi:hypothetical protein
MARRPMTGADGGVPATRRKRPATTRRRVPVAAVPRLVEDDTEVRAAEHAACDAQLLDLLDRLSA